MRLIAFDLDDTLMLCGKDYEAAKQEFGSYIEELTGIDADEAIELRTEIDQKNVETYGLSMERFPLSFVEAYDRLVDDPTDAGRDYVRDIGYSVFKTSEEYAERGLMAGAETLLSALKEHGFDLHLITAGDERVQTPKIEGLGLDRFFDETHITGLTDKGDVLTELMNRHEYTPDETYLVGNSLSSDIQAALDAGARGIYIPGHEWRPTENEEYYHQHERVSMYKTLAELAIDCPDFFLGGKADDAPVQ